MTAARGAADQTGTLGGMPARPSRRTVVAAVVTVPAAAAAGCTLSGPTPSRSPERRSAEVDPDVALLGEVAAATEAMVALYEGVLDRHRGLRRELRPLLATHRAHATALGEAAPSDASSQPPRSADRTPPAREDVPRRPEAAVRQLRAAERSAAGDLLDATRRAASGPFARLLASMSASVAQHVAVLAEVRAQ